MKASRQTHSSLNAGRLAGPAKHCFPWPDCTKETLLAPPRTDVGRGMKQICHLNLVPPPHVCNLREHTQHVFQSEVAIFDSHAFCSDHRLGVRWEFTAHAYFRRDVTLRITRLFLTTSVVSRPFLLWKLLSLSFEVSVTLPVFFFSSPPLSLYTIVFLLASCVLIVHS